jgi:hypothetical protein
MTARIVQELAVLKRQWPELEALEAADGRSWVRLPAYEVPPGWNHARVEVCFWIPNEAATAPYGFYVRPALMLLTGGSESHPSNYTNPAQGVPAELGAGWAMFSWSPLNRWHAHAEVERGDNMVHFVRSFHDRLEQLL